MPRLGRGAIRSVPRAFVELHCGCRCVSHGQVRIGAIARGDPSFDPVEEPSPNSFSASFGSHPHFDDVKELPLGPVANRRDDAYGLSARDGKKSRRVVSGRAARRPLGPCLIRKGGITLIRGAKGSGVCSKRTQPNATEDWTVGRLNPSNDNRAHEPSITRLWRPEPLMRIVQPSGIAVGRRAQVRGSLRAFPLGLTHKLEADRPQLTALPAIPRWKEGGNRGGVLCQTHIRRLQLYLRFSGIATVFSELHESHDL